MKFSVNSPCPCGSGKKYKKCCKVFHNGEKPSTALELMKSRYCAYAVNNANYIMKTTHESNSDYSTDKTSWEKSINQFIKDTQFKSLDILEFVEQQEEAFVTFRANIFIKGEDSSFIEKSRFVKQNGTWFYESGEFSQ